MKTLIQIQEEALAKLLEPRTSERRYLKLLGATRRWYVLQVKEHCDLSDGMAYETWSDVLDMRDLHREAV